MNWFMLMIQSFTMQYGLFGAFVVSIFESFIFPIPTVFIIAPTTALGVDPLVMTLVATAGSVIGALVGYFLGYYLGHPVAERLFSKHMKGVEKWFDKYGAGAVFIAAFTPIPFKAFTWFGGIVRMDLKPFVLASIAGRILQFAIAAYFGSAFGWFFLGL